MPRSPDFFKQLTAETLGELEEFARQPGRTVDECAGWCQDKAIQTSRSAVGRWLQDFRLADQNARAKELAAEYLRTASGGDATSITEASLRKFNELVFTALASGEELAPGELMKLSIALKTGLNAASLIENMKRDGREQMEKLKGQAKQKTITPEMIEACSKAVFG